MSGLWLLLQLVFGFAVVLAPGALLARTLGVRGASATLAWALALVFAALAVTFVVHGSLVLTLVLLLVGGVAALAYGIHRGRPRELVLNHHELPGRGAVVGAGALLGLLLWHVAGNVGGDGFFHLARIQKLLAFGDLSLSSANEFPDGGLHPGYAFPLWHGFIALVAKVSGADPVDVVLHGPTVLAPVAVLVAYEAGWALFRRAVPAGGVGRGGHRDRRDGARARRRAHGARAARHGVPAAPRPGCARARARGDTASRTRAPRLGRSCLARASRSSTRPTRYSCGSPSPASSACGGCGNGVTRDRAASRSPRSSSPPRCSSRGCCP